MTGAQKRDFQDARVFAALWSLIYYSDPGDDAFDSEQICDLAGVEGTNTFVSPGQATGSLNRLFQRGLVSNKGVVQIGRHERRAWGLTEFGSELGDWIHMFIKRVEE